MTEPIVLTREVELDLPADDLWRLISDGDRWSEWLTDQADVVVEPQRSGTVVDDGVERRVTIHSVVPGERVRFAWWPSDRPDESSVVELVVGPSGTGGRSRLSVIETYAASTPTTASASAKGDAWDTRLMMLALCIDAVSFARA
jgi:uncharacterized protein YndB with AHSA1/START domain